jgi:hypothetical protein
MAAFGDNGRALRADAHRGRLSTEPPPVDATPAGMRTLASIMRPLRRRAVTSALLAAGVAVARPARAVIILDSTWRAEGGGPGHESDGFDAHVALASEPQFDGVVPLCHAGNDVWGSGSATWVGNFNGVGYLLSAAHLWDRGGSAADYEYRMPDDSVAHGTALTLHPLWNWDNDERMGYDFAVVRLDGPVSDAGDPPLLYAGAGELGKRIVMVGYGSRGIGSVGQHPAYQPSEGKAAAENTIDEVKNAVRPVPAAGTGTEAGNSLRVTLQREAEGASRLDGLLGSGDSGGSAWIRTGGNWVIAGVNANGTGNATYGESSYFARVSGVREWLTRTVPGAMRFTA